jgi:hypothetical protein
MSSRGDSADPLVDREVIYAPVSGCRVQDEDGTCSHPSRVTPECHDWVCPRVSRETAQLLFYAR